MAHFLRDGRKDVTRDHVFVFYFFASHPWVLYCVFAINLATDIICLMQTCCEVQTLLRLRLDNQIQIAPTACSRQRVIILNKFNEPRLCRT